MRRGGGRNTIAALGARTGSRGRGFGIPVADVKKQKRRSMMSKVRAGKKPRAMGIGMDKATLRAIGGGVAMDDGENLFVIGDDEEYADGEEEEEGGSGSDDDDDTNDEDHIEYDIDDEDGQQYMQHTDHNEQRQHPNLCGIEDPRTAAEYGAFWALTGRAAVAQLVESMRACLEEVSTLQDPSLMMQGKTEEDRRAAITTMVCDGQNQNGATRGRGISWGERLVRTWINYQLGKVEYERRVYDLPEDLVDGEVYLALLIGSVAEDTQRKIKTALLNLDPEARMQVVLREVMAVLGP